MNCATAQRRLSQARDGALPAKAQESLKAHVDGCPDCRAFETRIARVGAWLQDRPVPQAPDPAIAWREIQRTLREPAPLPMPPRWAWWASPQWRLAGALAAAAVLLVALMLPRAHQPTSPTPPETPAVAESQPATRVLHLSTGLAGASTMVYEDASTGWTVIWVMPEEESGHA